MATTDDPSRPVPPPVAATGIEGLDVILHGGLPRDEMHLVQGTAGTGKTTIALNYLMEGVRRGEPTVYVTLSQSKQHLERIARSHGWPLDGMSVHELSPGTVADRIAARQSILPTADVELGELFRDLAELVERVRPRRAVIDSVTILQLLAGSPQRYHREVVILRQLFVEQGCTLLALADHPAEGSAQIHEPPEVMFHPLSGCVINLEHDLRVFGNVRRRLRVVKARGLPNDGGYHDMKISTGRMEVYARLGAYEQPEHRDFEQLSSDVESLDVLVGGGLTTGSSCLVVGPSGVGKSSVASLWAVSAASRGARAAIFLFDERPETYLVRSQRVGIDLRAHVEEGRITLRQLDPGEIEPGEFAQQVREAVDRDRATVVIVDSLLGYFAAMGVTAELIIQLHELMTFLTRRGVLLLMCAAQEGFMSIGTQDAVDVSYLSDAILALTFFEREGELRRAITVVKNKHGRHVSTIHELSLEGGELHVIAEPLREVHNLFVARRS